MITKELVANRLVRMDGYLLMLHRRRALLFNFASSWRLTILSIRLDTELTFLSLSEVSMLHCSSVI